MYYLINDDSALSFAQQIAICDTFHWLGAAMKTADARKEKTGQNWSVIKLESVYTTQTLHEAMLKSPDVPMMERA
jgi:hypothetical protein